MSNLTNIARRVHKRLTLKLPTRACLMHRAHHSVHLTYFGAAAMEGHGIYSAAAGILFLLGLLGVFLHVELA